MNMNVKWTAVLLVAVVVLCVRLAWAQAAAPAKPEVKAEAEDWTVRAKEQIRLTLSKYAYQYKPSDEQKAELEKTLLAQYKDLMDHDKVYKPKAKVIDDKIAELQKEIGILKKQKAVYTDKRAELLIDHKAELNNVFTRKQRIDYLVKYFKGYTVYRYWGGLTEAQQAAVTGKFEETALKIVEAPAEKQDDIMYAERRAIMSEIQKLLTPEAKQAGETKYMTDSIVRAYYRVKLTDQQKAKIRELCEAEAKKKTELYAQYRQLDKDRDAIRKAMYKFGSSESQRKMRAEVSEKILTEEQRKALSSRSSRTRRSSSSRGGSSRRSSKTPKPAPDRTKTPK